MYVLLNYMGPNTIFIEMVPVMVQDSSIVFINGKILYNNNNKKYKETNVLS